MLQEEVLITRLVERIESGNTFILEQIGKTIKEIGNMTPSQARSLQQMIKYGARYDTIVERLAKITNSNVKDIDEIFNAYAKKDYNFAEKFYKYRNIKYVPFNEFGALKQQTNAIANMTKNTYMNLVNSSVLGFRLLDPRGFYKFYNIQEAYNYAIDEAIISVAQGKDTFQNQMYHLLKQFGDSGVRTIDYASGKSRRLDSAIFMNMKDGLRQLHNETQELIGKEFGADGVEITVHEYPAPDHELAQGRQFSKEEYNKLQTTGVAITYDGLEINMHYHWKTKEAMTRSFRPISQYNCYHTKFDIVLDVSKPQYSNKELFEIMQRNEKGFDFEGKHLSMYEGTQLQRRIETEIRKQKDNQILGVSSGNKELIADAQYKITALTNRYRELSKISGLPTKMERMRVSGFKRRKV